MNIVILGLSITSSWGNGHATTFRSLVKGLNKRGHRVHFLERDVPWYAKNRDFTTAGYCKISLYSSLEELQQKYAQEIENAGLVIIGSYVPQGVEVGKWVVNAAKGVKAFYDIDTPVTLAKLEQADFEYLHPEIIPQFDLYLSFAGGYIPEIFTTKYGASAAKPLYCSVDTDLYFPEDVPVNWDLGYLGTYSPDRQPPLQKLLIDAAEKWSEGKFIVAGPQFPSTIKWPRNVERTEHLPPAKHRKFYNRQRFTLNVTRKNMVDMGYSPSVRLFEAAACGIPVISDFWEGLDEFFKIGEEILVSKSAEETIYFLKNYSESNRKQLGENARRKVLKSHSGEMRAKELENYVNELKTSGVELNK